MKKCQFKIILILKNAPKVIVSINIYNFIIFHICANKCIKYIIIYEFFSQQYKIAQC